MHLSNIPLWNRNMGVLRNIVYCEIWNRCIIKSYNRDIYLNLNIESTYTNTKLPTRSLETYKYRCRPTYAYTRIRVYSHYVSDWCRCQIFQVVAWEGTEILAAHRISEIVKFSRACPWVRLFLLCQIYLLSEQVGGSSAVFLCMRASEPRIMPYPTGDGRRAPAILPWAHGPVSWGLPCNHGNDDHVPARHDFRFIATQWLQQIIIWDTPAIYTLTPRCWLLATTSW